MLSCRLKKKNPRGSNCKNGKTPEDHTVLSQSNCSVPEQKCSRIFIGVLNYPAPKLVKFSMSGIWPKLTKHAKNQRRLNAWLKKIYKGSHEADIGRSRGWGQPEQEWVTCLPGLLHETLNKQTNKQINAPQLTITFTPWFKTLQMHFIPLLQLHARHWLCCWWWCYYRY